MNFIARIVTLISKSWCVYLILWPPVRSVAQKTYRKNFHAAPSRRVTARAALWVRAKGHPRDAAAAPVQIAVPAEGKL